MQAVTRSVSEGECPVDIIEQQRHPPSLTLRVTFVVAPPRQDLRVLRVSIRSFDGRCLSH